MIEKLKCIYNHFGPEVQAEKLLEESAELNEAIREGDKQHIAKELADVNVLLMQIANVYGIGLTDIWSVVDNKINRTIERIESGYYENAGE